MKIGILTFHYQLNYGGVLQCFALFSVLKKMGHDVVVIDRRFEKNRSCDLKYFDAHLTSLLGWTVRSLLGSNRIAMWIRACRTKKLIGKYIALTPYKFIDWKDAPKNLGVDIVVVGSDQVWHCGGWNDPRPYFLDGAPNVRAIAYAASFGASRIPPAYMDICKRGFARFEKISIRESSAVAMLHQFGRDGVPVLDPTLLADKNIWNKFVVKNRIKSGGGYIVCYFIGKSEFDVRSTLEHYAVANDCFVDVYMNLQEIPSQGLRSAWKNFKLGRRKVRFRYASSPSEFVGAIKAADSVITDSFHALMFSTIFGKNLRFLKPTNDSCLAEGFSRIKDFVSEFIKGPVLADSLDLALHSLRIGRIIYDNSKISERRHQSLSWLSCAIEK